MAFEKSNQKMCKLMAKSGLFFADSFCVSGILLNQNQTIILSRPKISITKTVIFLIECLDQV